MDKLFLHKDVAVIGAGPVGIFSVFALGMVGLNVCVIDGADVVGGKCAMLYPEKPIYDIPAVVSLTAGDLVKQLVLQANPFDPHYVLSRRVIGLMREEDSSLFKLTTHKGDVITAKAIIICAGAGAFMPNKPAIEGLSEFEEKSVLYSVLDKSRLHGKKIVVAGGGDSALDWVLLLKDFVASMTLVHRRTTFRAHAATQEPLLKAMEAGEVCLKAPCQLSKLKGAGGRLTHVVVKNIENGEEEALEADFLLPFFGITTNLAEIETWGLTMVQRQIVVDPTTSRASIDGIYAMGDVSVYPNKRKLIAVGFSEAMLAAQDIYKYIYPDKVFHAGYSTNIGVPGVK